MLHMKKTKAAVFAAVAACAGIAFADEGVAKHSFEEELPNVWSGDGKLEDASISTPPQGGYPISDATHTKALLIEGEVTCTDASTPGTTKQIDLLINVAEEGDTLTDDDAGGGKIAIAVGDEADNGTVALKAFCKAKNAEKEGWVTIKDAITLGEWHRVTLKFDYTKGACQISVDGEPAVSDYGYLTAAKDNNTANGAWYVFANDPAAEGTAQIDFAGCALVDDVVITDANGTAPEPLGNVTIASGEVSGSSIPLPKLAEWGVDATTINSAQLDGTGMTVAEKLACGLEPDDDVPFAATDMKLSPAGVPTITFPGSAVAKNGVTPNYTIKVYDGSKASTDDGYDVTSSFTQGTVQSAGEGRVSASMTPKGSATIPKVLKFVVTAGAAAAPSGN